MVQIKALKRKELKCESEGTRGGHGKESKRWRQNWDFEERQQGTTRWHSNGYIQKEEQIKGSTRWPWQEVSWGKGEARAWAMAAACATQGDKERT